MKRFIPTDIKAVKILESMASRINDIFLALKQLGNFDNQIKINRSENDYFIMGLTTIDNNGDRFTFEGSSVGKIDEIMSEKKDGKITIIYSLFKGYNEKDIKLTPKTLIDKLRSGYNYETSLNITNGHPIKRSIKKGDLEFSFATSSAYNFNEGYFKSRVADSEALTFMEFVELVKNNLFVLEEDIEFITFTVKKGDKGFGRIVIEKGNVTRFSLEETIDNQTLTLNLEDGTLVETASITMGIVISSLPQSLIGTIEKARKLMKGNN